MPDARGKMKLEIWVKGKKKMFVKQAPHCEWRYEIRNGVTWISGMTLYTLIRDGWKLKGHRGVANGE